jgi:hypothetical protein
MTIPIIIFCIALSCFLFGLLITLITATLPGDHEIRILLFKTTAFRLGLFLLLFSIPVLFIAWMFR